MKNRLKFKNALHLAKRSALTILAILAWSFAKSQCGNTTSTSNCPNAGFEMGNRTNWQFQIHGRNTTGQLSQTFWQLYGNYTNGSFGKVYNRPNGNNSTDPKSCGNVLRTPPGTNWSMMLNDSALITGAGSGNSSERARYTFVVDKNNSLFVLRYSAFVAVHELWLHSNYRGRPFFRFMVYRNNDTTQKINPNCSRFEQIGFSAREQATGQAQFQMPGFQQCVLPKLANDPAFPIPGTFPPVNRTTDTIMYKNWTNIGIDLTGEIGNTVTLEFIASTCDNSGNHYAYAYINAQCYPTVDTINYCAGNVTLKAPKGFTGYQWGANAGGGTLDSVVLSNPAPGAYTVSLITDKAGCNLTHTFVIRKSTGGGDFTFSTPTCANTTVNFTSQKPVSQCNPVTGLSWNFGDGGTSVLDNPTHTYPPGTYTVTLVLNTQQGCTDTTRKSFTVPTCGVSVNATGGAVCPEACSSISATGSSGTTPYTYTWNPGGFTGAGPHNVCPGTATVYTVTMTDAAGLTASAIATVTVHPIPAITAIATPICPGGTSTLTAGGGTGTNYTWQTGTTPATGNPVFASPAQTTTYTVTGINTQGCTNSSTAVVIVNAIPTINVASITLCKDSTGILTAGGCSNYTWFPGGTTGASLSVTPNSIGVTTYTIVCNSGGCSNSTTATVTASDCSTPTVSLTGNQFCIGGCHFLQANAMGGIGPYTYQWIPNLGNGTGPYNECPSATTSYTVVVFDSKGDSDTATATITVYPQPVVTATGFTVCAGNAATLSASGAFTYTWQQGGMTGNPVTVNPAQTTTYTVTGTDINMCTNTAIAVVVINPNPVIATTGASICQGNCTNISATGSGGLAPYTYAWIPTGQTGSPINVCPATGSTYTVTAVDANGCSGIAAASVNVDVIPVLSVNSAAFCSGASATLTASGAANYTWLPMNSNGSSVSVNPTASTTYTVIGASPAGCSSSIIATVTVNPIPVVYFEPDTAGCTPLVVTFKNLSQASLGNSSCAWNFGGGVPGSSTSCNPSPVTYSTPGVYSVTLTVTSNGCSASLARPNIITVHPYPAALFTASPMVTDIMDPTITFTNQSTGDDTCWWNFGDGATDPACGPVLKHTYEDTGTYTVCLNIQNQFGCPDDYCLDIIIKPIWSYYIPNAFTPNGDGKNELFIGKSWNVIEHEMWIFDRWGNMIYYTGQTSSPETAKGWDGRANGGVDIAQEDVYVWVVNIKDIFNKRHKLIGHVSLVK